MAVSRVPDTRDQQEHGDVDAILAALPEQHPARVAYSEGADTIRLTHLVPIELAKELTEAFLAGYNRMLRRTGRHFRP